MGEEIQATHFRQADFEKFKRELSRETSELRSWEAEHQLSQRHGVAGIELEMWIVDEQGSPLPINQRLIDQANHPDIVKELSQFNVEFNVDPQPMEGRGLERLVGELSENWDACEQAAQSLGARVVSIGTLPTVNESQLSLQYISQGGRYRALNEQVMRLRHGRPIRLAIEGTESLQVEHSDVMLEAGTTSFQIHFQVSAERGVDTFNASLLASAPLVALAANSPLLFGKLLWDETRIPLFEQAVDCGEGPARVTFGTGFASHSLLDWFDENRDSYPILLPSISQRKAETLPHLRLHNGTIWRWNRPLIGFDIDGTPHVRIEQRVAAAGPTVEDMGANLAFYFGLTQALASDLQAGVALPSFEVVRANFYAAAQRGWDAEVIWLNQWRGSVARLIEELLLPLAARGLEELRVADDFARRSLSIVQQRVSTRQHGALWQRRFVDRYGRDPNRLVQEYSIRQRSQEPVHTWTL